MNKKIHRQKYSLLFLRGLFRSPLILLLAQWSCDICRWYLPQLLSSKEIKFKSWILFMFYFIYFIQSCWRMERRSEYKTTNTKSTSVSVDFNACFSCFSFFLSVFRSFFLFSTTAWKSALINGNLGNQYVLCISRSQPPYFILWLRP